jgi:hypothetical protein
MEYFEIFDKGFEVDRASLTYRQHLILKCVSGGTGKSTLARLLSFVVRFSNYISLESFLKDKHRNSIIYFFVQTQMSSGNF